MISGGNAAISPQFEHKKQSFDVGGSPSHNEVRKSDSPQDMASNDNRFKGAFSTNQMLQMTNSQFSFQI